jgi:hypothetical protein
MGFESVTDEKISTLLKSKKRVTNPNIREKPKEGHVQKNYKVVNEEGLNFELYLRQNSLEGMEDDFSCGLSWIAPNGEVLTLTRYNGSSHDHPNNIEKTRTGRVCHIHIATEKYIKANKKPEGFAEATERYSNLNGALHCLITDCNISGISTTAEEPSLPFPK